MGKTEGRRARGPAPRLFPSYKATEGPDTRGEEDRQGARTAKPRRKPTTGVCLSYVGYADAFKFHLKGH